MESKRSDESLPGIETIYERGHEDEPLTDEELEDKPLSAEEIKEHRAWLAMHCPPRVLATLDAERQRAEGAERERKLYWDCYQRAMAVYRWMRSQEVQAQSRLATAEEALREAIPDFVGRVNSRAEAEMQRTGTLEGAHHRAIEVELAALKEEGSDCDLACFKRDHMEDGSE